MPKIVESQREIIRQSLDEIAAEVAIALRDAHLGFPVFLTVPNSGGSLATMASPLDPSDGDWSHASEIVCRIIGQRLGDARLCGRSLHCAVANATMGAADVLAETASEELPSADVIRQRAGHLLASWLRDLRRRSCSLWRDLATDQHR